MIETATPASLIAEAMQAWRPPRRVRLSTWADQNFYLSAESSAEAGRWRSIPYQRGILDAFTDPSISHIAVMKSARIGWTKCLNAAVAYFLVEDPCPIMIVQPTVEDAQGYSKEEIAPMFRDVPLLADRASTATNRDPDNTILTKRVRGGGSVSMVGATSPRGFRRTSRRVVGFDEVDGYPLSAGAEGDPIALGSKRTEYYWNRKIAAGSTPTIAGLSRIERLFFEGDQRRYYVPCPDCHTPQVLRFAQFKWPKDNPHAAVYVCIHCGSEVAHRHKPEMLEAGDWRPGPHAQFPDDPPPEPEDGHVSFHIWAAYSTSPNASWGQLAAEFVTANRQGSESLKTYCNTTLGEVWKEKADAPEWQRLYERRETYAIGTCPRGVLFLTAGVDVQKDRLVYEVIGWGRDKVSWSVDYGVLHGDTSTPAPWKLLEAATLNRTFPHAAGGELPITTMAVDSGYNTSEVYNWCRRFPMSRVMAVRGVSTAHMLIGQPSKVDVTIGGRKLKRGYKVWPVAPHVAKAELYGWLRQDRPIDLAPPPPGYVHIPQYEPEFFKQLTGEALQIYKDRRGFAVQAWTPIPGRENHALDCRVYGRAAAMVVGLDRFRDHEWARYEANIGTAPPLAVPPPAPPPQAATGGGRPPEPAPAGPAGARGWLSRGPGQGRGGWLRRRR